MATLKDARDAYVIGAAVYAFAQMYPSLNRHVETITAKNHALSVRAELTMGAMILADRMYGRDPRDGTERDLETPVSDQSFNTSVSAISKVSFSVKSSAPCLQSSFALQFTAAPYESDEWVTGQQTSGLGPRIFRR